MPRLGSPRSTPIRTAFTELARRHDAFMLVEGAGGLLVPFDAKTTMADLALALELPILIVARASLGTINHTRLTIESAEARGIEILGVVVSHSAGPLSDADARNLDVLRTTLGPRLIGEVMPAADPSSVSPFDAGLETILDRRKRAAAR